MRRSRAPGGRRAVRVRSGGAAAVAALALTAAAPVPALAADQKPKPSAKELREAYPLDPSGDAGGRPAAPPERNAATPTPAPTREADPAPAAEQPRDATRAAAESDDGLGSGLVSALLVGLIVVAGATAALVIRRRRSGGAPPAAPTAAPQAAAATPLFAVLERPDPSADPDPAADGEAPARTRRDAGARRANGSAAAPAVAPAGTRPRRATAVGEVPARGGRLLAAAGSHPRPAAAHESVAETRADAGGAGPGVPRTPGPEPAAGSPRDVPRTPGSEPAPAAPRDRLRAPGPDPVPAAPRAEGRPDAPGPGSGHQDPLGPAGPFERAGAASAPAGLPDRGAPPAGPADARTPGPPDPAAAWTAAVEWRATDGQPRFAVLATADAGGETIEIATSEPVRWPPAGPDDVAALNAIVAGLERALIAAGWRSLEPGDGWYAKRFAWIPQEAAATEQPALPPPRLTAVDAPGQLRRRPAEAPAARRPGPPRESFAAPPSLPARAPRPGRFEPGAAAGEFADEAGTGRFVRRRPWPEDTDGLWRCEIKWDAGYKTSRFTATMRRPGARRGQAVAASDPFKWMLMAEPDDAAEYRAAVEALVRAVRAAGWERIDPGPEWWAERFVWRRDEPPPESLEPEPVRTDRADAQP